MKDYYYSCFVSTKSTWYSKLYFYNKIYFYLLCNWSYKMNAIIMSIYLTNFKIYNLKSKLKLIPQKIKQILNQKYMDKLISKIKLIKLKMSGQGTIIRYQSGWSLKMKFDRRISAPVPVLYTQSESSLRMLYIQLQVCPYHHFPY